MLAAASLLTAGLTALSVVPASAQTHTQKPAHTAEASSSGLKALAAASCPAHAFCGYSNINFNVTGGSQWNYNATVLPLRIWMPVKDCSSASSCPGANDHIESYYNNRTYDTFISKNWPYSGNLQCLAVSGNGGNEANLNGLDWPDGHSGTPDPLINSISAVRLTTVGAPISGYCAYPGG